MIRSMTAFSRQEAKDAWGSLVWELRSVNHRYLEPSFRLPDGFRELEPAARELVRKRLTRGKVECTLRFQPDASTQGELAINKTLAAQLVTAAKQINALAAQTGAVNPTDILRWPGVVEGKETDFKELQEVALELFNAALNDLNTCRNREGAELASFIEKRLIGIREQVAIVKARLPSVLVNQRERLLAKLNELKSELNMDRLEQEMVYFAQRIDVAEELDRLSTHIEEGGRILREGGQAGRRLDFLLQEFNREANTLGSKSVDSVITQAAVELKVLIEQIREQVQNIE